MTITPAHRTPFRAAVATCICVGIVAIGPILAELVSAVHGDHLFTAETVEFGLLPIASLAIGGILAARIRKAKSRGMAVLLAVVAILVAVGGCVPTVALFTSLLVGQLTQVAP